MDRFESLKREVSPAFERFAALGEDGFGRLSERDQTLIAVWSLLGEVGNGGFAQFFYNSSREWAVETIQALERIGARKVARLVAAACEVFPGGMPSPDDDERHRQIRSLGADEASADEVCATWARLENELHGMEPEIEQDLFQYASWGSLAADA